MPSQGNRLSVKYRVLLAAAILYMVLSMTLFGFACFCIGTGTLRLVPEKDTDFQDGGVLIGRYADGSERLYLVHRFRRFVWLESRDVDHPGWTQ